MLLTVLFGVISGLALGLTGGGGSVIAVPLLLYGDNLSAHQAINVSLMSVFVTAALGALQRWLQRELQLLAALMMILGGVIGAPIGTSLNSVFSPRMLMLLFAVLMAVVGARMWFKATRENGVAAELAATPVVLPSKWWLLLAGIVTGVLTGLLGVGGGFLIVPALLFAGKLPMRQAIATSLLVIAVTCLLSIVSHLFKGGLGDFEIAAYFAVGSVAGMFAGSWLARYIPAVFLQKGFAILVILLGIFMLVHKL